MHVQIDTFLRNMHQFDTVNRYWSLVFPEPSMRASPYRLLGPADLLAGCGFNNSAVLPALVSLTSVCELPLK